MRNVGTFFGVIAMALAASVSIDNQMLSIPKPELAGSNLTIPNSNNSETSKGFWEWVTGVISGTGGPSPVATVPTVGSVADVQKHCAPCTCGLTNKRTRIVGGIETKENQYPWMAILLSQGRFYCGGTVVTDRHILTAAHCVEGFEKKYLTVRLLVHDMNSASNGKLLEFKVEKIIKHSGYSTLNYNNDIALIKLSSVIKFNESLRPVCLPEFSKTFAGQNGTVTGWGATGESGPISNILREVTVPILSNTECKATNYPSRRITDNMLCAGYTEGGKDSCQGDSGGPLHVVKDSVHSIVGVVSWGEGCAAPNYPGVYARVNRFLTWIQHNTGDACRC